MDLSFVSSSNKNTVCSFSRSILILSASLSVWGHPEYGCKDNSDKTKPFDTRNECRGKNYTYYEYGTFKSAEGDWKWFACQKTKQCIPIQFHCDGYPHPRCVYKDANGTNIAEDEESCVDKR